jgi:DNA repair protein RadC
MKKTQNSLPITSWSPQDQPRERLLQKGATSLSEAELLAIILGFGCRKEHALDLAKRILGDRQDALRRLGGVSVNRLMEYEGIGPGKAVKIVATMELARRFAAGPLPKTRSVRRSEDAFKHLKSLFAGLAHEEFWVLYLNNANHIQHRFQLSKGGLTGTLVDVRIILKKALEIGAVGLILAHNHPSGNLSPSKADLQITRKTKKASAMMDIRLLDHLIVHGEEYYSFADEQLL